MQDLLQRLQGLNEIIASGPVVLSKLDELVRGAGTPAEAMMILLNQNFQVTRNAPRANNNQRHQAFNFSSIRAVNSGRSFV